MMTGKMRKGAAVLVLALAACGLNQQPETKKAEGTLVLGHEVRSFADREDGKTYWVIDKSGRLAEAYVQAAGEPVMNGKPVDAVLNVRKLPAPTEGFGVGYDGTYEVEGVVSLQAKGTSAEGCWTEPVPGQPGKVQGFCLYAGGRAVSVNMATLQYESWKMPGRQLVLSGKSIGNRQTITFSDTYTVKRLADDELVLQKGGQTLTYRR